MFVVRYTGTEEREQLSVHRPIPLPFYNTQGYSATTAQEQQQQQQSTATAFSLSQ